MTHGHRRNYTTLTDATTGNRNPVLATKVFTSIAIDHIGASPTWAALPDFS